MPIVALLFRLVLLGTFVWLGMRLWPAIRSEPSTWLGEDWREKIKRPRTT
jgi:hypothetical protein